MKTKLIAVTAPVDASMSAEQIMAYAARVSSPENQSNHDTAPKLLKYCIKNGHWSVFEMADMTVEIKTNMAVAAQILRHKSFNFQQFSGRYAKMPCEFDAIEARAPHPKNRQLSLDNLSDSVKMEFRNRLDQVEKLAFHTYEHALRIGIANEVARFILPMSTMTTMYMKGSVRSWLTYFMQRLASATQLEHRRIAQDIFVLFGEKFPDCAAVLKEIHPELEYPSDIISVT